MLLTIQPKGEKGRAFSADLVAHATADLLWNDTDTNCTRPLWAVFAGPSEQLRAFTENLRLGHVASSGTDRGASRFEFLKSAPYRWWTRLLPAGGSCTTVAHPSFLSWRVPAEDAFRYRFLVIPARSWLAAQRFDLGRASLTLDRLLASSIADEVATDSEYVSTDYETYPYRNIYRIKTRIRVEGEPLADLLGYGALLLHYLDHRLPLPIPRDPVFGAWLLLVGHYGRGPVRLQSRIVSRYDERIGYVVETPDAAGCAPGFVFSGHWLMGQRLSGEAELQAIAGWLAREVKRWSDVGGL